MITVGDSDNVFASRQATDMGELRSIAQHPAFRLGVLDAQAGKPLDHDLIGDRIGDEFDGDVRLAQYRYEEGRYLALLYDVYVRTWLPGGSLPPEVRTILHRHAAVIAAGVAEMSAKNLSPAVCCAAPAGGGERSLEERRSRVRVALRGSPDAGRRRPDRNRHLSRAAFSLSAGWLA